MKQVLLTYQFFRQEIWGTERLRYLSTTTELISAGGETQPLRVGSMTILSAKENAAKYAFMLSPCKGKSFLPSILALTLQHWAVPATRLRVSILMLQFWSRCHCLYSNNAGIAQFSVFYSENHHFKTLTCAFSFWFSHTGRKINMLHNLSE